MPGFQNFEKVKTAVLNKSEGGQTVVGGQAQGSWKNSHFYPGYFSIEHGSLTNITSKIVNCTKYQSYTMLYMQEIYTDCPMNNE